MSRRLGCGYGVARALVLAAALGVFAPAGAMAHRDRVAPLGELGRIQTGELGRIQTVPAEFDPAYLRIEGDEEAAESVRVER